MNEAKLDETVQRQPRPAAVFIGLDLAWSSRNPSGGAVLFDGRLMDWRADLGGNDDVLAFVAAWAVTDRATVVAVDAPLCVPNETGARICDKAITKTWGRYKAGAHPANRQRVAYDGGAVRGELLADLLESELGFVQRVPIEPAPRARLLCEVFPHAAHVSLFELTERLRYKAKPGWDYAARWRGFDRYQSLLRRLACADPPLHAQELLAVTAAGKRGKRLKALEDALDALTCAYAAAYAWRHGPAGQFVYGTVDSGHILVPRRVDQAGLPSADKSGSSV